MEEGLLRFRLVADVLDGFLDDSAAIGMEGKFNKVALEEAEELDFVDFEALLEDFLENIVAKFVSYQGYSFVVDGLEYRVFILVCPIL